MVTDAWHLASVRHEGANFWLVRMVTLPSAPFACRFLHQMNVQSAAEGQPQLVEGLPTQVLYLVLEKLPSTDIIALMRASKRAHAAVLHSAPCIWIFVRSDKSCTHSIAQLVQLLATRTEALHLGLVLSEGTDAQTKQLLNQLATQQYSGEEGMGVCVISPSASMQRCVQAFDLGMHLHVWDHLIAMLSLNAEVLFMK